MKTNIMDFEKYQRTKHRNPYIFRLKKGSKKFVFFGSDHSWNKKHPEMKQIKQEFRRLNPEIALIEGDQLGPQWISEEEAISSKGEGGLVEYLCQKLAIKVLPSDPPEKRVIKKLLKKYSKDELFLYFVLRILDQYPKVKKKQPFELCISRVLDEYKKITNWTYDFSFKNFENVYKKILKKDFKLNYLGYSTDLFDPTQNFAITNTISRDDGKIRDLYTINLLIKLIKKFNRIFLIKGSFHAVMLEPAIKEIFKNEIS